jgi:hypothetical protein
MPKNRKAERELSRVLRKQGRSLKSIAKELRVSPSSVMIWTKDLELTEEQRDSLSPKKRVNQPSPEKPTALSGRKTLAREEAEGQWSSVVNDPKLLFALALYVGEGRKATVGGEISISSVDPKLILSTIPLFEFAGVRRDEMFAGVHLPNPPEVSSEEAVEYWSGQLGLSREQFQKTIIQTQPRKLPVKYPHGVCYVGARRVETKVKIDTWMQHAMDEYGCL